MNFSKNSILVLLVFTCYITSAQSTIDSALKYRHQAYPIEKIAVHTDKSVYLPGETIWFKGYIWANEALSPISKVVYIEWADQHGSVIQKMQLPIENAMFKGDFLLPDTIASSIIHCRMYTQWMLNFEEAYLYHKSFTVVQPNVIQNDGPVQLNTSLKFFPEGGDWIENLSTNIAYKAYDQFGMPRAIVGTVWSSTNELVGTIQSNSQGRGVLAITPKPNEYYRVVWKAADSIEHIDYLPAPQKQGVVLNVIRNGIDKALFKLQVSEDAPAEFKEGFLVATQSAQLLFRAKINFKQSTITSGLPLHQFPYGVIQLTYLNKNLQPIAERIFFNYQNLDTTSLQLSSTNNPLQAKSLHQIELAIQDSNWVNCSVAITDAAIQSDDELKIVEQYNLKSTLKGYIHQLGNYFKNIDEKKVMEFDWVMLTNGWRKIVWNQVLNFEPIPIQYEPDIDFFSVTGQIENLTPKQIKEVQEITLIFKSRDGSTEFVNAPVNDHGLFSVGGVPFADTVQVYFQFRLKRAYENKAQLKLYINKKEIQGSVIALPEWSTFKHTSDSVMLAYRNAQLKAEELMKDATLNAVVVKAQLKKQQKLLDEKYTNGMFKGDSRASFNVLDDPAATTYRNALDYLMGRIAGLTIRFDGQNYTVTWRGDQTALFWNEMQVQPQMLQNFSMNDIAYIKVYQPPFFGATMGGSGGAIAIYSRKGDEPGTIASDAKVVNFVGYTPSKIFYEPDYSIVDALSKLPDTRTTLYWNPSIHLNQQKKIFPIRFFNNDYAKKLRVLIQGVNQFGQIVSQEYYLQ